LSWRKSCIWSTSQ
jgi:hypothetical protein